MPREVELFNGLDSNRAKPDGIVVSIEAEMALHDIAAREPLQWVHEGRWIGLRYVRFQDHKAVQLDFDRRSDDCDPTVLPVT